METTPQRIEHVDTDPRSRIAAAVAVASRAVSKAKKQQLI
jgi:hypothetical protein